jgi:hypothetical protein
MLFESSGIEAVPDSPAAAYSKRSVTLCIGANIDMDIRIDADIDTRGDARGIAIECPGTLASAPDAVMPTLLPGPMSMSAGIDIAISSPGVAELAV